MFADADPRLNGSAEPYAPPAPEPLFRPLEPAQPLPLDALPPSIRAGVEGVHGRTQAPRGLVLGSTLSVAALAASREINVRLHTGQVRPVVLFLLPIAVTGERKTSTDNEAGVAICEWEAAARVGCEADADRHRIELTVWEEREKEIRKKYKKDPDAMRRALEELGPAPPAPLRPEILCDEPTMEGVWLQLKECQGYVGVFNGEGGQFLGGHAMNPDNKLRSAAALNKLWDGADLRRTRRGDGITNLSNRRVCLHLMVQPEAAASFLSDPVLTDLGLTSRLLACSPESAVGTRLGDRTPESEAQYARWLSASRGWWRRKVKHVKPGDAALDLRTLELSDAAAEAVEAFARHVERNLGAGGAYAAISGFGNKLAEHATRLAAVFAYAEDQDGENVSLDSITRGIRLAEWYASEALRLFHASTLSPELVEAERVRAWIMSEWATGKLTEGQPQEFVSLADVYQRGPSAVRDADRARRNVEILERHGNLVRSPVPVEIRGNKRREAWRIVKAPTP